MDRHHSPGWVAAVTAAATLVLTVATSPHVLDLSWWAMPVAGVAAGFVMFLITVIQAADADRDDGWLLIGAYRIVTVLAAAGWATWTVLAGWSLLRLGFLVAGAAILAGIGHQLAAPVPVTHPKQLVIEADRRPALVREWEARIAQVLRQQVRVEWCRPWPNRDDGFRLLVHLSTELGTVADDLAIIAGKLAASARLPQGCAVQVSAGPYQGTAYVDVMLRNVLADQRAPHQEPATKASITDPFPVMMTPQGQPMSISLRIDSMVVGGTVGSGKTTLLDRIIMWLARCTDALIWVIDLNGGGLAEKWILAWAQGRATAPVVDWVADNEPEAAAMVATAIEIARDRKTNREAVTRMRAANATVLPLDKDLPAIIIITDEGGEVRQAVSLFGKLASQGLSRVAQIGRAAAVRVVLSVLRGTSDLTDKGLRVNAALRLCLRMAEWDEYYHVLTKSPSKADLGGVIGAGFLFTPQMSNPTLGVTVNVDLAGADEHSIACAALRPVLDARAKLIASRVGPAIILGGRQSAGEHMTHDVMRDAAAGAVYTNRWGRYKSRLAEMRGDPAEEFDDVAVAPTAADLDALNTWAARVEAGTRPTTPVVPTSSAPPR
jgi:hypothetical protein